MPYDLLCNYLTLPLTICKQTGTAIFKQDFSLQRQVVGWIQSWAIFFQPLNRNINNRKTPNMFPPTHLKASAQEYKSMMRLFLIHQFLITTTEYNLLCYFYTQRQRV